MAVFQNTNTNIVTTIANGSGTLSVVGSVWTSGNLIAATGNLSIVGNVTATGEVTSYSDAKLKTEVKTIANPLEIMKQLRGVDYVNIASGEPGSGVIAQEAQAARPMLVKDHNGTLTVNYGGFSGVFIEAINALIDKVAALEAEVAELKNQK